MDGHRSYEQTKFLRTNKIFSGQLFCSEKKLTFYERLWDRSEQRKNYRFFKTNEKNILQRFKSV